MPGPDGPVIGWLVGFVLCGSTLALFASASSSGRSPGRRLAGSRRRPTRSPQRRPLGSEQPVPGVDPPGTVPMDLATMDLAPMDLAPMGLAPMGLAPMDLAPMDLEATAGLTDRLAALLEAGLPVRECWLILADPVDRTSASGLGAFAAATVTTARVARVVADVVTSGGSVGDGLRLSGRGSRRRSWTRWSGVRGRRSSDGLFWLAAVWDVTEECGAAPSEVLRAVARSLRDERELQAAVDTAAAGPRATVLVLAVMPLASLFLGGTLGTDPVHVLFGTAAGRACLASGAVLWAVGLLWARRLTQLC